MGTRGAVVLKWEAVGVEWYHHKLMNGVTHVDVNAHTILEVLNRLDKNGDKVKWLVIFSQCFCKSRTGYRNIS